MEHLGASDAGGAGADERIVGGMSVIGMIGFVVCGIVDIIEPSQKRANLAASRRIRIR